jgi:prepilin peptidase CpaA
VSLGWHQALLAIALAACAIAAAIDLRTGRIPDWLTLGLLAAAPALHAAAVLVVAPRAWSAGALAASESVGSGVLAAIVPFLLARSGGLGGGDVKLLAAVGATCGVFASLYAQTYAYVAAMIYALVLVTRRGRLRTTLSNVGRLVTRPRSAEAAEPGERHAGFTEVKFGPAIFVGMCMTVWARWRS